jgi:NAD+ synthase (glutamine-hydrolysing)
MYKFIGLTGDLGFLRIGTAVPELRVADVDFNVGKMLELARQAADEGVQVLAFPEMAITAYTIGDLVQQQALLTRVERSLGLLLDESINHNMIILAGLPLSVDGKIFNCAAVLYRGRVMGVVPKTYIPNYKEYYEERWFASGSDAATDHLDIFNTHVPFGADLLFAIQGMPAATFGIEICEDLWIPFSPHEYQAVMGATLLFNLSASNEILTKADWRRTLVAAESGRCAAAYCYVSVGIGESSNDLVFGGHSLIAENGNILKESQRLQPGAQLLIADIDLDRLAYERRAITSLQQPHSHSRPFRVVEIEMGDVSASKLHREIDPHPFVPRDPARRAERCRDIFAMQVAALAKKLTGSGLEHIVLGVSGGLDSTLALLVAARTMDFVGLPRENVHAFTLPGFGTTSRTKSNALSLCKALKVSYSQVSILRSCKAHMADLKHNGDEDVVFENVQARYRTEFLFNKANELNAIVLGTGDLTEVALGWCTFSGDHMSHYDANVSVPKTLVQYMVRWVAEEEMARTAARRILLDVLDTPISPELRRPQKGRITQMSEQVIGPVELADFYLYPFVRYGARPGKILFLANEARKRGLFEVTYNYNELYKWLKSFIERFFANQFKRTCIPEGPKIGSVSLSPRGDWRMPSDASSALWLEDLEAMHLKLRD